MDVKAQKENPADSPLAVETRKGASLNQRKLHLLKIELLKKVKLFSFLPESVLDQIVQKSSDLILHKGEILFEEGKQEKKMYIILSGQMLVYRRQKKIAVLGQGEYLGEMPLIDSKTRSASVKSLGETYLMDFSEEFFEKYISSHPDAMHEMMQTFSSRIRHDLDDMSDEVRKLSNFTHDMRNCLVPLSIAEDLLAQMCESLEGNQEKHKKRSGWKKVNKCFETMLSVKNNLTTLIDQSMACATKTVTQYVKAKLELQPLIHETIAEISCHKYLKKKKIEVHFGDDVKDAYFNYLDIKRVLQNLLLNSGYATQENGLIQVLVKIDNGNIQVSVKDEGSGIPDDIKPVLLKENYTSKFDGNGFGLLSCKEIIEELHQGKIWFESEVGKGTTFHFQFPVHND